MDLLPSRMDSDKSRVMLLAICGQEADFHHRWQVHDAKRPNSMGAARGLWQFERGGGVRGVLNHPASKDLAKEVCGERGVAATMSAVYSALHADDVLAACFARLLLWTDPAPLPSLGDFDGAFALYLRTWRPGAYDRGTVAVRSKLRRKWGDYYDQAVIAVTAERDLGYLRGTAV